MNPIRVLIADDHQLLREALSLIINQDPGFEVIASCENNTEALEITAAELPDIVLMDINIPPFSGIEATFKITRSFPGSRVIGMSAHCSPVYVRKMMTMGARGYVTKNSSTDEIILAMKCVHHGNTYICQDIKNILGEQLGNETASATGINLLTEREIQIVGLVKNGLSSKEIAFAMGIAVKTVEAHRHHVLQKLNLRNSASLVNILYKEINAIV